MESYPVNPMHRDGRGSYCKPCLSSYMADRRSRGLTKNKPADAAWARYRHQAKRQRNGRERPEAREFLLPWGKRLGASLSAA